MIKQIKQKYLALSFIENKMVSQWKRKFFVIGSLIVVGLLLTFPIRLLLAEYYSMRAGTVLDDQITQMSDIGDISVERIDSYNKAFQLLQKSASFAPSHAVYQKALSDIQTRLDSWAEATRIMGGRLPMEAIGNMHEYSKAIDHLEKAISLEPTNPDYHLALAMLYSKLKNDTLFERELNAAVYAYPGNAAIRYSVACAFLLAGKKEKALEQARELAAIDDTYMISDSPQKALLVERRMPAYLSHLSGSFLYKALEITWRATDKNLLAVKTVGPDSTDAHEVVGLFLEMKGVEE